MDCRIVDFGSGHGPSYRDQLLGSHNKPDALPIFLAGHKQWCNSSLLRGAASLNQLVVADRGEMKNLCVCFKKAAASMGVNPDRAKQLPELCNINVPLSIDPNINCDAIPLSKSSFELNRNKYLGSKGQSVPSPGAGHGTPAHAH